MIDFRPDEHTLLTVVATVETFKPESFLHIPEYVSIAICAGANRMYVVDSPLFKMSKGLKSACIKSREILESDVV